ncbi:hypothetical protein Tco_1026585 [Tanacetum coccineum]
MIQAEKHPLMFDEFMSTPIDFLVFSMNRLKFNKIIRADLVGRVFNLLKGTYKSCIELEYNMEECYQDLIDQLGWANPEGHKSPVDMSKPLPLQDKEGRLTILVKFFFNNDLEYLKAGNKERTYSSSITKTPTASVVSVQVEKRFVYGYLKEIVVRRVDHKLYKFKEGDFSDLHLNDIKDMLLLITQNKLFNLDSDVIVDFITSLKMFTRGIVVKNRVEDVQLGVESYQRKLHLTKPQRTCQHLSVKEPYTPNYDPPGIIYEDKRKKKRLMRADEIHKFYDGTLISSEKLRSAGWWQKNKDRQTTSQNLRDLPRDIPLDSIEVLRYSDKENKQVRSVLTEPEGHVKMDMEIPRFSILIRSKSNTIMRVDSERINMQCSPLMEASSLRYGNIKRDAMLQNKYVSYVNNRLGWFIEEGELAFIDKETGYSKRLIDSNEGRGGGGLVVLGGKSSRDSKNRCKEVGGVEKISSTGSKFMANREDCLDGCDGAGGGEVKGGGVNFGVLKSSPGEIPGETIGERGGDKMGLGGGPI